MWEFRTLAHLNSARLPYEEISTAMVLLTTSFLIPSAERLLVLDALSEVEAEVTFQTSGWQEHLEHALVQEGRAILSASSDSVPDLRRSILVFLVTPIDTGTLLLYPRIRAVLRDGHNLRITLELVSPGEISAIAAQSEEAQRMTESVTVFNEIMGAPDKAIPNSVLSKAEGVAVFPGTIKGGFVIGAQHGRGILSAHNTTAWTPPAQLTLTTAPWRNLGSSALANPARRSASAAVLNPSGRRPTM